MGTQGLQTELEILPPDSMEAGDDGGSEPAWASTLLASRDSTAVDALAPINGEGRETGATRVIGAFDGALRETACAVGALAFDRDLSAELGRLRLVSLSAGASGLLVLSMNT